MIDYNSPEEFITARVSTRLRPALLKDDVFKLAKEQGCEVTEKMSKRELVTVLADTFGYAKLQELTHTGVSSFDFQEKFDITHKDVKLMECKGFLKVTGYREVRMYGKYRDVPLYDAFQFFGLTKPEVDAWLTENRPKQRKAKANEDT